MGASTIVLGLGNPGPKYARTRHNLGFRVADILAERTRTTFKTSSDLGRAAWVAEATIAERSVVLAKPRTYMNRVGPAAAALCTQYGVSPQDLVVVHDDADLELGRIRIRAEGQAGGHNGIRSLLEALGTPVFPRVKLGVRGADRSETDLADYVLDEFSRDEEPIVETMVVDAADAVVAILEKGLVAAMNAYNAPRSAPSAE